jgi:tryptophan synthase alpha chain
MFARFKSTDDFFRRAFFCKFQQNTSLIFRIKMNRLSALTRSKQKLFAAYLMPDFPIKDATVPALLSLELCGVNLIELAMPHSDPLADGRVIQEAAQTALRNGATLKRTLATLNQARKQGLSAAVILMGYINPILQYGIDAFLNEAKSSGADGFIIPDLPPEEAQSFREKCLSQGLSLVFLISPSSSPERMQRIDALSTDLIYALAVNATTGTAKLANENALLNIEPYLNQIRANTQKKFIVGFGIRSRPQMDWILARADGAVVGFAYLQAISNAATLEAVSAQTDAFWRQLITQKARESNTAAAFEVS